MSLDLDLHQLITPQNVFEIVGARTYKPLAKEIREVSGSENALGVRVRISGYLGSLDREEIESLQRIADRCGYEPRCQRKQ